MALRLRHDVYYNKTWHRAGTEVSALIAYPTIFLQVFLFGAFCFGFAYATRWPNLAALMVIGGAGIAFFVLFYSALFGLAEMGWMLVNGAIGVLGMLSQIDAVLSLFGKSVDDYGYVAHIFPLIYWTMATFVLWQLVLHLTGATDNAARRQWVNIAYALGSAGVYAGFWWVRQP